MFDLALVDINKDKIHDNYKKVKNRVNDQLPHNPLPIVLTIYQFRSKWYSTESLKVEHNLLLHLCNATSSHPPGFTKLNFLYTYIDIYLI